ncbi:hypothetical protein RclHR1_05790007 [Rhizophagus clarus]|uniref:Four-helix bundle copper-binding protein n=1 Tax=Rhizophagus clarus TaxID=94130 RepID=A0A2Z6RP79_9GLOM|nr:hypothetical protein RclHR1_05790007 [Rhizophagus clarus]GES79518.1 four-helix bundle copper-binding protein [Rhizophagus clarus]
MPHLDSIKACAQSAAACTNCAEMSGTEGCSKQCRANAALASCTAQLMSLDAPQLNSMIELTIKSAQSCVDHCGKHSNEHCKACVEAAQNLGSNLRKFQERVTS